MSSWKEGTVYTQDDINCMRAALVRACEALYFAFPRGNVDQRTKQILARQILAAFAEGETNAALLSADALRRLPPLEAFHTRHTRPVFLRPRNILPNREKAVPTPAVFEERLPELTS